MRRIGVLCLWASFNPHSPPRGSATATDARRGCSMRVSILTPPRGGVPRRVGRTRAAELLFQSSLPPEGECHCRTWAMPRVLIIVSILTPPRGGVPHAARDVIDVTGSSFQSSLPPEGECHADTVRRLGEAFGFQSSLPPEGECHATDVVSLLLSITFQSSLPPEGECHSDHTRHCGETVMFQSSLPPEGECHYLT